MTRNILMALIAGGLLSATLGAADRPTLAEQKAARQALRAATHPTAPARIHPAATAPAGNTQAAVSSASTQDGFRYRALKEDLMAGRQLSAADKAFFEEFTNRRWHKGGGHQVDEGGPDTFGNTWIMTGDEGGPTYSWVDIPEGNRNYITLSDDNYLGPFDMGGALSYYGTSYSEIYIASNGMIGFSEDAMWSLGNGPLPDGITPNNLLAFFWDDINPGAGGSVYYGLVGGDFVMTYDNVPEFGGTGTMTAQVVIDFNGPAIYYNYDALNGLDVSGCTVGIENADGTDGLQVILDGSPFTPTAQTTIRFDLAPPPDYAMIFSPSLLSMPVGSPGLVSRQVTLTNTGLLQDVVTLDANLEVLDVSLWSEDGTTPLSGPVTIDALDNFVFTVRVEAEEGLGAMVDEGYVYAFSSGSDNEYELPLAVSVISTHGGPDAYGNTWALTGDPEGDDFFWIDLAEEDRNYLQLNGDSQAGPIDLGGVLSYYGEAHTEVYISSNGFMGFQSDFMYMWDNTPLPDPQDFYPQEIIALLWDDLEPGFGGSVYYGHDELGRFVLSYEGVSNTFGNGTVTVQAVVDFDDQRIYINTADISGAFDANSCTVGIENADGSDGLQVFYNGDPFSPVAETTLRFDLAPPPDYAVSLPPTLLVMGAEGGTYDWPLTVLNPGLLAESYTLDLDDTGATFDWSIVDAEGNTITTVGPIASFESEPIYIRMTIPDNPAATDDFVTVTVTCTHDLEAYDTTLINGRSVISSGNDAWGNSWISSLDLDGPPSTWIELPEEDRTYVDFPGGPDSYSGPFELPQALNFYGGSYTEFYVSAKAYLGFNPENMFTWGNSNLPTPETPNAQIYVFWDDMNPVADSGGQVYYGTDEDGRLVLTWEGLRTYFDGPEWVTVQAVVDAAGNRILLNYLEFSDAMFTEGCTVGIENEDGTVAMEVLYDGQPFSPSPGLTIQMDLAPPPDYWFAMTDFVSTVGSPDSEAAGTFTISNTGLVADSYALSAFNANGMEVRTEINGNPVSVTPTIQPGGSIDVDLVLEIPEVPPVALTQSTLEATSNGNNQTFRSGLMETRIVLVQGGPDAGGYFWSTSDADGQVEYNWETLTNPVTVPLGDDNYAGPFDLGMTWNHYDTDYTQVYIGSNGYIGFSSDAMGTIGGQDMPDPWTPNGIICAFQDDLLPAGGGTVSYSAEGDMFIVQFLDVVEYGGSGTISFQIILDGSEDAVRINYQSLNAIDTSFYTIGQEDGAGSMGFTAALWGQGWLPTNESAVWFGFNVIGPSGPYAVRINPDEAAGVGINGGYAEYEFEVENRGDNPSTFDLGVTGNIWDVTFHDIEDDWAEITQVPNLVYDEVFALGVRVHVPAEPVSYTDQALVTVTATGHPEAEAEANILTTASCNHVSQMIANVTGTGLFGMEHLSDGEYIDNNSLTFIASGVNRMVNLNMNGTVGTISVLPAGHDYLGIAYDSRDNSYWVSYLGGVSHVSATGSLIAAFSPALLASGTGRIPTGLAFDADHNILWAICSHGGSDDFVRLDVSNAAAPVGLNAMTVPWSAPFGSGAAGLDYHEETDQMVALHTVTGASECFLDLGNGSVDARGDYCPSGLADGHGVALTPDGDLYVGWTNGLAHPVDQYRAPCDFGVSVGGPLPLPVAYELKPNYPNPFNPSTTIRYALPAAGIVRLEVYNLLGQHQATLVEGLRPAGYHEVRFDAGNLASGVYFSRVTVQDATGRETYSAVQKMMLMK